MELRLAVLKSVFNSYHTRAYSLIFLFLAMIYLIIKNKKEQRNLLIYEIFGILLLVTPFIGNKIITLGAKSEANWPVYGILCAIPVTAYAAVCMLWDIRSQKERYAFLAAFLIVMQCGLGISVTGRQFVIPQNLQKSSAAALEIAEELGENREWYVMAPLQVAGELRECDETLRVFFDTGYEDLQKDLSLLQSEAAYYGCNCIILERFYDSEEDMLAGGYGKLADVGEYVIYISGD